MDPDDSNEVNMSEILENLVPFRAKRGESAFDVARLLGLESIKTRPVRASSVFIKCESFGYSFY